MLHCVSVSMIGAEDPRARGKGIAHHGFGLFDATNPADNLGLDARRADRLMGLLAIEISCEFHSIGGMPQRLFHSAHFSESQARIPAVDEANFLIPTPFHSRSDSRQNLERLAPSTHYIVVASPLDVARQDGSEMDWILIIHVLNCFGGFFVQALGHVELLEA